MDLTDPVITCKHDAYPERGISYRFNGQWSKTVDLYKWIHTSWTYECEMSLCSNGFITFLFHHIEDSQRVFELGPWFWGRVGFFITPLVSIAIMHLYTSSINSFDSIPSLCKMSDIIVSHEWSSTRFLMLISYPLSNLISSLNI